MEEALGKLEEELTCPICLQCYSEPRILSCCHTYCRRCLEGIASRQPQNNSISCPVCQQSCALPEGGVPRLKTAFHIQHLIEISQSLSHAQEKPEAEVKNTFKETFSSSSEGPEAALANSISETCSEHEGEQLELYCETCDVLVCLHCTLKGRAHHKHDYELVKEVRERCVQDVKTALEPVDSLLMAVGNALKMLEKHEGGVVERSSTMEDEIHDLVQQLHTSLNHEEGALLDRLRQIREKKMSALSKERKQLSHMQAKMLSCKGVIGESLRTCSAGDLVIMKSKLLNLIREVCAVCSSWHESSDTTPPDSTDVTPSESALHGVILQDSTDMRLCPIQEQDLRIGKVITSASPNPAMFHASGKGLRRGIVGETSVVTVHAVNYIDCPCLEDIPHTQWQCRLVSEITGDTVTGSVERAGQSHYQITHQPQIKGRHQLHIKVDDKLIRGSPFTVSVRGQPQHPHRLLRAISGLWGPWSVSLLGPEGALVVSEYGAHCVSLFSPAGAKLLSFGGRGSGPGQLNGPHGVTVDSEGNILVVDNGNSRIQKFSPTGEFLQAVGGEGRGPVKFSCVQNIACSPVNGKIYVVDWSHRVQILNPDLTLCGSFGKEGCKKGQFDHPWDVACDESGKVYVSDTDNHRVQVFTPEGHFLKALGVGSKGQGLRHPMGLCVGAGGVLYVGHSGNRVSILSYKDGATVGSFEVEPAVMGEGEGLESCDQAYLSGLVVDECGVVCVCDGLSNQVKFF